MLEFVTLRSEFCDTYFCVCDTHFRDLGGGEKVIHFNEKYLITNNVINMFLSIYYQRFLFLLLALLLRTL